MAADPLFAQLMEQQLQAAEAARHAAAGAGSGGQDDAEQQQQQQQPQPPGFRDLTVYASLAADARMAAAQELLQQAVAAAVGMWQNQSSEALQQPRGQEALQALVPAVLPYRLQQLAQQLEASAAAAAAAAATAVASASTRGSGEQLEGEDGWISYRTAEAHRDLIKAYCSSKAQLARQLLASM
jgi:hypothetical protein